MVIVLVVIAKLSMDTDGESILNLLVNRREFDRKRSEEHTSELQSR